MGQQSADKIAVKCFNKITLIYLLVNVPILTKHPTRQGINLNGRFYDFNLSAKFSWIYSNSPRFKLIL